MRSCWSKASIVKRFASDKCLHMVQLTHGTDVASTRWSTLRISTPFFVQQIGDGRCGLNQAQHTNTRFLPRFRAQDAKPLRPACLISLSLHNVHRELRLPLPSPPILLFLLLPLSLSFYSAPGPPFILKGDSTGTMRMENMW
jgi:hypothetical protein